MFYNNISLHIVRLLLSSINFDVEYGVSLDILFKCYCSTLRQDVEEKEGVERIGRRRSGYDIDFRAFF